MQFKLLRKQEINLLFLTRRLEDFKMIRFFFKVSQLNLKIPEQLENESFCYENEFNFEDSISQDWLFVFIFCFSISYQHCLILSLEIVCEAI